MWNKNNFLTRILKWPLCPLGVEKGKGTWGDGNPWVNEGRFLILPETGGKLMSEISPLVLGIYYRNLKEILDELGGKIVDEF